MRTVALRLGYMPLVDAAPLIAANEMGFAEEEGLALTLEACPSWATLRDKLSFGQFDAAHMLSAVPVATAVGVGGAGVDLHALSVLSLNGTVIGVSAPLAEALRHADHAFGFENAEAAGRALIAAKGQGLRIGVPFPFSMHAELVYYWLSALGLHAPQSVEVRTVPPPQMADAIESGHVDAFCVGEPWGSLAVETGAAELLLPGVAIWSMAPEKVLAVRESWAAEHGDVAHRLIRAMWRAGRWLGDANSISLASELLSKSQYLGLPSELVERALLGQFMISQRGEHRVVKEFVTFHAGAAGFPWRSQAEWIGDRLAARNGLDRDQARLKARETFRSDLYRAALDGVTADLPSASAKVEGALPAPMVAGSVGAPLILGRNRFFDGQVFDPFAGK